MPKSRKLEELIEALRQIRPEPTSEAGLLTLRQAIGSRYGVAAAQAAQLVAEFTIEPLVPDLVAAFQRFMVKPQESDPGCRAKQAIADALYHLNYGEETLFLQGIRHIQKEPVWGGQVDTAPRLRGTCALGLVRMNYRSVLVELADLLADPESEARIGAARAIAYSANDAGVPLLRLRIQLGDTPSVLSEYVLALLQLAPEASLPLVQDLLYGRQPQGQQGQVEVMEVIALALAESRLPAAFSLLRDWWQQTHQQELKKVGLLAIASLRQDDAFDFLLDLVRQGSKAQAQAALDALGLYQQDTLLWQRVKQAMAEAP